MKKITALILIFVLCLSLTACDPIRYSYDYDDLINNVTGIELIKYDNPEQKSFRSWVPNHYSKLRSFKLDNMTILETLDSEFFDDLLNQLSTVKFLDRYYDVDSPNGTCIRLLYSNSDFEIISCDYEDSFCGYAGKYNSNGDVIDFAGAFENGADFKDLINNFFETQIAAD